MTMSDLEQTLAEARATAARRLAALNRLEGGAVQPAQPEPVVVAVPVGAPRHAPEPEPVRPVRAQIVADRDLAGPEPLAAYPQYEDVAIDYVEVESVPQDHRMNPRTALRAQRPDEAGVGERAGAKARDLAARVMNSFVAGVSDLRTRYAQRRDLARAAARVEADSVERVSAPLPQKHRLTEKERRWERRRKRYLFEEVLGWILVPVILVGLYFAAIWLLELFGTSPDELIEGVKTIWTQFR